MTKELHKYQRIAEVVLGENPERDVREVLSGKRAILRRLCEEPGFTKVTDEEWVELNQLYAFLGRLIKCVNELGFTVEE